MVFDIKENGGKIAHSLELRTSCNVFKDDMPQSLFIYNSGGGTESGVLDAPWASIVDSIMTDTRVEFVEATDGLRINFKPEVGEVRMDETDAINVSDVLLNLINTSQPCG